MMNVEKIAGDFALCHPSLRSGSQTLAHVSLAAQMLRFAQHDMSDLPSFFVNIHHRVPMKVVAALTFPQHWCIEHMFDIILH